VFEDLDTFRTVGNKEADILENIVAWQDYFQMKDSMLERPNC